MRGMFTLGLENVGEFEADFAQFRLTTLNKHDNQESYK